jgi:Family of unknown function (DUF6529)
MGRRGLARNDEERAYDSANDRKADGNVPAARDLLAVVQLVHNLDSGYLRRAGAARGRRGRIARRSVDRLNTHVPVPLLDVASSYGDLVTTVFSAPILAKVWLATFAAVLVLVQLSTAARMWGRLRGVVRLSDATAKQVHRWSGRLAILFTLPVVFHCTTILGFQTTSLRVAVHSIAGSFIYGVFAVKMLVIRDRRHPAWALPVLGGTVAALLVLLWLTSSVWYLGKFGFSW